jgi:hypothetical protein
LIADQLGQIERAAIEEVLPGCAQQEWIGTALPWFL